LSKILIDITRLVYRRLKGKLPTGIDRVSLEYISYYAHQSRAVLSLGPFSARLSQQDSTKIFAALADRTLPFTKIGLSAIAKSFLWRWIMSAADIRGSYVFNTGHMGLEDKNYAWSLRQLGAKPIVVIHDLIPVTHPEYCRPGERERHVTRMKCAIKISAGIIANSQHTLTVLENFGRGQRLPMPPSLVALLAGGIPDQALAARPISAPYFVILGTIEPRKNHWMLLQIWRQLVETMGKSAPKLVVIGQRGWECENVVDLLERTTQLKQSVIELPSCSDEQLGTYLHHAQALLFPSFAEGYGMPITEALSIGVPVIASDLAVFREIAGDVPEFIEPLDGKKWQQVIADYTVAQSVPRAAQLQRIKSFNPTTWSQHFEAVDAFLLRLEQGSQ
jgi:glycosyltransferase involved in cell wall biosynthesis